MWLTTRKFARDNVTVNQITASRQRVEEMVFQLHYTIRYIFFQFSTCMKMRWKADMSSI